MALSTRELYLALRVRDEGTRNMQRFAQELVRTGTAARVASLKAQADSIREQAALKRNEIAVKRVELARLRENDASRAQIRGVTSRITEMQKESIALEKQAQEYDRQATAIQRHSQRLTHITSTLTQVGVALETVGVAFGFAGAAGITVMAKFTATAMEYQRQVAATATQVDGFGANLKELSEIGIRVARDIAVPFEQVQPALFDIFSSMEIGIKDAEILLEAFAKAAVAGQTDIQNVSRATIGIMNAFGVPITEVNHLLDLQFQLVQEGIGTYTEWVERIGLVAPSAVRAGQSIETMLAALAVTTRFGIAASRSATAVSRAFDAMSNPKAIEDMEKLGLQVRNADGTLRPFNLVMREFRDVLNTFPVKDRVGVILDVFQGAGSTIEARRFLQSMLLGAQGIELFDTVLNEMNNDSGSFAQAYEIMANTTAMKTDLIGNRWKILKETIGEHLLPHLEKLLAVGTKVFDWFDKLSPQTKGAIAQFLLWGSVLAIAMGFILTFIGILAVFVASIAATWSIMAVLVIVVGSVVATIVALAAVFIIGWNASNTFREGIKGFMSDCQEALQIVIDLGKGIITAFKEKALPPLKELFKLIEERVLPAFFKFRDEIWEQLKPKLEEAARIIQDLAEKAFAGVGWVINNIVIPAVTMLTEWWERNKKTLEPFIAIAIQLVKWLLIIGAVIVGVLVVVFVGPLVAAVATVVLAFVAFVEVGQFLWSVTLKIWAALVKVGNAFKDLWETVKNFFTNAKGVFGDFNQMILNQFINAGTWLKNAGESFVMGFVNGIQNKLQWAVDKVKSFGSSIIGGFGKILGIASPSKVMMGFGMESAQGYILGWQQIMSQQMAGQPQAFLGRRPDEMMPRNVAARVEGVGALQPASMPANAEKHITNNITVNTQELDAREQAARLGWELAGRM